MNIKKPQINRPIKSRIVKANRLFLFSIRKHFLPRNDKLEFILVNYPYWLKIDTFSGVLSGTPPRNTHLKQFLVTVKAKNEYGEISQTFFIKVVETDIVEAYAQKLENILSLRKRIHRIPTEHPKTHDLLEYLFELLNYSDDWPKIHEELKEKAEEHGVELSEDVTYDEFKEVIEKTNPGVEKEMLERIGKEHILANAELNNAEFRNLYRQGSAPLGVHAIAVWNYLGIADPHTWSSVSNVLDSAGESIIHLRQETQKHNVEEHNISDKIDRLKPKP